MEGLLTFFLMMQLPDVVFAPVYAGGLYLISDLVSEIKAEDAIDEACELYVKDYTDCEPEWRWGNHEGVLDYQELLGCPIDLLQKEVFDNSLTKLEPGKHGSHKDYSLIVYIRESICVKVEYWRPRNNYFLSCYGYGDDDSFHVYSELLGKEYPIDLNISYFDLLNFIFNGRDPQMLITVRLCADKMPYVSEVRCHCKY